VTLGVVAALLAASTLIKYLWPVRRMRAADVSTWSLAAGAVLGIIGFFVIPVLGLVIGFVLGVYLAELVNRRDHRVAWTSTVFVPHRMVDTEPAGPGVRARAQATTALAEMRGA